MRSVRGLSILNEVTPHFRLDHHLPRTLSSVVRRLLFELQIPQRGPGGPRRGCVAADHAAALFPAALAFDLVGGRAVLGPAAGHADALAVAAEEPPVDQARGFGDRLHPPGDLRFRQPEDFFVAGHPRRSYRVKSIHRGGGDGDHGALGLHVGLGADHGDAAATVVPGAGRRPR